MRPFAASLAALLAALGLSSFGFAQNAAVATAAPPPVPPLAEPRFVRRSVLPALAPITLDRESLFEGPTKLIARKYGLQARILWIDATANIERTNTGAKIVLLVDRIRRAGFNTIVLDVKPLSGQTIYPSAFAPKLREWRGGRVLPEGFDPVAVFAREARRSGLVLFGAMNAFADGHRLVNVGPGFDRPAEQSVVYEAAPLVRAGSATYPASAEGERFKVGVTGAARSLPGTGFCVTTRANGTVVDGYELGIPNAPTPTVPKGGYVLFGEGGAAEFLRTNAKPGARVGMDSSARFVRLPESGDKQIPLMTQPTNPVVRGRLVNLAQEFVRNYDVAGIVYDDRLRYTGMDGDFSPATRAEFERRVGRPLRWPDDVFKFTYTLGMPLGNRPAGIEPGPYYAQWMAFRPQVLKEFVGEIRSAMRAVRPGAQLGVYAGSWYGEYPALGNNWADPGFEGGFWANDRAYSAAGLAPSLDLLVTGCYYPTPTIFDAMRAGRSIGATVESAGTLSYRAARDATWTAAGISLADFKDDPEGLEACLQAAAASTNGVMCFDLSHDIEPLWPVFERAFRVSAAAPYGRASFLEEVRRRRATMPTVYPRTIVSGGAAGAGQ